MRTIDEVKSDLQAANNSLRDVHGGKVTAENRDAVKAASEKVRAVQTELDEVVKAEAEAAEQRKADAELHRRTEELLSQPARRDTPAPPAAVLRDDTGRRDLRPKWLREYEDGADYGGDDEFDPEADEAMLRWVTGGARGEHRECTIGNNPDLDSGGTSFAQLRQARAAGDPLMAGATPGSTTVPDDQRFMARFVEAEKAFRGVERYATVLTTTNGRPLPFLYVDDTGNDAAAVAEGAAAAAPAELVITKPQLDAYKMGSGPYPVTYEMLTDGGPPISQFLAGALGTRCGRKAAAWFASGTGANQPNGILSSTAKGADIQYDVSDGGLKDPHKAGLAIVRAVEIAYRRMPRSVALLSDDLMYELQTAIGTDGQFLFPNIAFMGPDNVRRISGMRVDIEPNYPEIGKTAGDTTKVATVGYHREFVIRRVRGVRITRNPFLKGNEDQVVFNAFLRVDSDQIDARAIRHVLCTAVA